MSILYVSINGHDASKGEQIDIDLSDGPYDVTFKLHNTSTYMTIYNIKFVTGMPKQAYKVVSIPDTINPRGNANAVIRIIPENILALAEAMGSKKEPSRFTYKTRAAYSI